MAAVFGSSNLLTTINFGTKKIYKISLANNSILKTNFTMENSVEPGFFFSNYSLTIDTRVPCDNAYLSFYNPQINVEALTVSYSANDINIGYYGISRTGTYNINENTLSSLTLKTGCSCNRTSLTFPAKTVTAHQYDDISQPASQSITFTFSSYSAMSNFLNSNTVWEI